MKKLLLAVIALLCFWTSQAQKSTGYKIEVQIDQAVASEIYLAYHFGAKQYIKDTAQAVGGGKYIFEGSETLDGGLYLVAMPPNNRYFELLISKNSQSFTVATDTANYGLGLKVVGSEENELFQAYIKTIAEKRTAAKKYQEQLQDSAASPETMENAQAMIDQITEEVEALQQTIIDRPGGLFISTLLKANKEVPLAPAPDGMDEEQAQLFRLYNYRSHYFDNINWGDERLLRTPIFEKKILDYLERLTPKNPDSISAGVDHIIALANNGGNEEIKKFCVSRLLNEYAQSKIMGMDAVYVHIALKYYSKEKTPWIDDDQLSKILDNAQRLEPLLIGKKAPDLSLEILDGAGKKATLHGVTAKYTILYFWDPDCGNCTKMSEELVPLYQEFKAYGIEIFGVCNKASDELDKCSKKVAEKGIKWINTADPYGLGQAHAKYFIRSNPIIFLLDEQKTIKFKRIDVAQLREILNRELGLTKE